MFLAELTEAIRLICTQFFLQQLKFGVVEGQYVLAPASAFWLFLASFIYESKAMYEKDAFGIITNNIPIFIIASFMGIGVNYLSYLVIQSTSSLTMKILGTARNVMVIIIGVLFYAEVITLHEGLGYLVALVGFVGYNLAKSGYFEKGLPTTVTNGKEKSTYPTLSMTGLGGGVTSKASDGRGDYDKLDLDVGDTPRGER
eukprot:gene31426-38813_t